METPARHRQLPARLLLAAVIGATALLATGRHSAAAATSASLNATAGCDLAVINDWSDNNRVDKIYAIPCYTQAIQRLSHYPDVQGYSSAIDDIRNALLAAIRQDRDGHPRLGQCALGAAAADRARRARRSAPPHRRGNVDRTPHPGAPDDARAGPRTASVATGRSVR